MDLAVGFHMFLYATIVICVFYQEITITDFKFHLRDLRIGFQIRTDRFIPLVISDTVTIPESLALSGFVHVTV